MPGNEKSPIDLVEMIANIFIQIGVGLITGLLLELFKFLLEN